MPAELIKFGDPPSTPGGDVEREVAARLRKELPDGYLLVSSYSQSTLRSSFYEYDLLLLSPFLYDVLEVKNLVPGVTVEEDLLVTDSGYEEPSVFSLAETKARVLRSNHYAKSWFSDADEVRVTSRIILGPNCRSVRFKHKPHQTNHKVFTVDDAILYYARHYRAAAKGHDKPRLGMWQRAQKKYWESQAQKLGAAPKRDRLGRFRILQILPAADTSREYKAVDEPPCKADVHLKEYLFDPLLSGKNLEAYLEDITREMQLLRKLRHPYLCCVVGHFRTGWSLVQVSDWFDGQLLSELCEALGQATLPEVVRLMIPIAQALAYCHEQGVFHRNLDAAQVLVAPNRNDIRLKGFALAKEVDRTGTVSTDRLQQRDPRLIPPEELGRRVEHYGRYDVYQLGILYYRMLEGGAWPWETARGAAIRPMTGHEEEPGIVAVRRLVHAMLSENPDERPFPMDSVENALRDAQSG